MQPVTFSYRAPPINDGGNCCQRTLRKIAEKISACVRWIICRITTCLGVTLHGYYSNAQLKELLNKFSICRLLKQGPYESSVLSEKAQKLILKSFKGLKRVVDTHLHILGYDGGNYLNPNLNRCCSGIKFSVIHCAASGTPRYDGSTDLSAERLQLYAEHFPRLQGIILPIHPTVAPDGTIDWDNTGSMLDNSVAVHTAKTFKGKASKLFSGVSVHPNDPEWETKLREAHAKGIFLIKWFPTQGINPSDDNLDGFYQVVKELGMTIIAHSGPQHTIPCPDEWKDWGHPKYFEKPLQLGVNMILAHSGHKENWQDFIALAEKAEKEEWPGKLYGDLGGMLHYGPEFAKSLILNSHKKGVRILYGSDYPYVNIVSPTKDPFKQLANAGLLEDEAVGPLKEIRQFNPLLANFIAVRNLCVKTEEREISFPVATFTGKHADGALKLFDKKQME